MVQLCSSTGRGRGLYAYGDVDNKATGQACHDVYGFGPEQIYSLAILTHGRI